MTRLMGRDVNAVIPLEFRERRRGIKTIPPVGNSKRRDESFESSNFPFFLLEHHRTTLYSHCSIIVVSLNEGKHWAASTNSYSTLFALLREREPESSPNVSFRLLRTRKRV